MRVVIADDSLLLREGLARLLREAGFMTVAQVGDVASLLGAAETHRPDVAIIDVRMPPTYTTEGLIATRRLRQRWPNIGVLLLSQYVETHYALQLLEDQPYGTGYLLKDRISDLTEFASAVRRVGSGGSAIDPEVVAQLVQPIQARKQIAQLTERERDVLGLMAEGRSNQAICDRLCLSPKTLESHVRNVFSKLELPDTHDDNRRVLAVLHYLDSL